MARLGTCTGQEWLLRVKKRVVVHSSGWFVDIIMPTVARKQLTEAVTIINRKAHTRKKLENSKTDAETASAFLLATTW